MRVQPESVSLGRMSSIKRHLSYANVMSTIAVFAVLGGGAYAAGKIGPKDIGKNAVRSEHIKKKQVRAKHISGKVPNANKIDGIDSADLQQGNGFDAAGAGVLDQIAERDVAFTPGGKVRFVCDTAPTFQFFDQTDGEQTWFWDDDGTASNIFDGSNGFLSPLATGSYSVTAHVWDGSGWVSELRLSAFWVPGPSQCRYAVSHQMSFPATTTALAAVRAKARAAGVGE